MASLQRYSSSKYPNHPGLPLGARYEFDWVPYSQRVRGDRQFMFNFMGSISSVKPDRVALQDAVEGHNWSTPIVWRVTQEMAASTNAAE